MPSPTQDILIFTHAKNLSPQQCPALSLALSPLTHAQHSHPSPMPSTHTSTLTPYPCLSLSHMHSHPYPYVALPCEHTLWSVCKHRLLPVSVLCDVTLVSVMDPSSVWLIANALFAGLIGHSQNSIHSLSMAVSFYGQICFHVRCVRVCVHACTCVFVRACVRACVCVCVCVCVYVRACVLVDSLSGTFHAAITSVKY